MNQLELSFISTPEDRERLNQQCRRVLAALERGERLTQWNVMTWAPPIMRLAARIGELRQAGYHIKTEKLETAGRGKVAQYVLEA